MPDEPQPKRKPGRPPKPGPPKPQRKKHTPGPHFNTTGPRKRGLPPSVKFRSQKHRGKWSPKFGCPTVLCKEMTDDLCELIRAGNYLQTAATVLGINNDLISTWTKKGRAILRDATSDAFVPGDYEYVYFVTQLRLAHAEAEALDLDRLNHCIALGDSKALLKKMGMRYGKRWREKKEFRERIEYGGKVEHRHEHTHAVLTVEDLKKLPVEVLKTMLSALREKGQVPEGLPAGKNGLIELPKDGQ